MQPSTAPFVFQLQLADYAVIAVVLLSLVAVGFACRRMVTNTRDFFVGGGRMSWSLAGMSAFMAGFSAWTFTGAAGLAYTNGHVAILYFLLGQFGGFMFAALFIAHRCRQTRKVTTAEIVRDRFGRATEQAVVVLHLLSVVPMGAVWLTGLALFFSVGFSVPMVPCIIVAGTLIIIYSTLGGSWAVATSDFVQGILLVLMVTLIAGLSLGQIGGVGELVERVPVNVRQGFGGERTVGWLLAGGAIAFINFAAFAPGARFLAVQDGRAARKVAWLAGGLFLVGPVLWFTPPIAASYFFPDLAASLPQLKHPQEGSYMIMGLSVLPAGLVGLLLMCIFGATLTTLDSAVNQTSGFLTLNVYRTWFRRQASDRELVIVARAFSVVFGLVVMSLALILVRDGTHSLLDLNLNLQSIIAVPMLVPFFLLWFVRRAPWWSAIASMAAGIAVSYCLNKNVFWPAGGFHPEPLITALLGLGSWPDGQPFPFAVRVAGTLGTSVAVFLGSQLLGRRASAAGQEMVAQFYRTMDRPVDAARELPGREDPRQFLISGMLLITIGVTLVLVGMAGMAGRSASGITATFGLVVVLIGVALCRFGRRSERTAPAVVGVESNEPGEDRP